MPRTYDSSTPGVEYVRVPYVQIRYDRAQRAEIGYDNQLAVKLADGSIRHVDGGGPSRDVFTIDPSQWADSIPMVVNPTSGATNGTTTWGAVMLHILSALRHRQNEVDAANEPQPE